MYIYDEIDQRIVDERVSQFRDQTRRHLAGELSEDDFRPLRTTARRDGSDWVITGSKQFTTHGRIGRTMIVTAVTDPARRRHGISA